MPTVYGFCDNHCKYPVLEAEEKNVIGSCDLLGTSTATIPTTINLERLNKKFTDYKMIILTYEYIGEDNRRVLASTVIPIQAFMSGTGDHQAVYNDGRAISMAHVAYIDEYRASVYVTCPTEGKFTVNLTGVK